jgi:hypothetical protein
VDKLTHKEMYDEVMERLDKHQTSYFEGYQVEKYLNESYMEFIKSRVPYLEKDIRNDISLIDLRKSFEVNNTDLVNLDLVNPKFYLPIRVEGTFTFVCKGESKDRKLAITPITNDRLSAAWTDPNNRPTNQFPMYVLSSELNSRTLTIYSTTAPKQVKIFYVMEPATIKIESNPNGKTEVGYAQQIEIISLAVQKMMVTTNNPSYQQLLEQNQNNKNNDVR